MKKTAKNKIVKTGNKENKERTGIAKKRQEVARLSEEIKNYPIVAVINLRGLPDSLLQSLKRKLRELDGSVVRVSKLIVIKKVLDSIGLNKESAKLSDPIALLLTKQSPHSLTKFFRENMKKLGAKAGQITPYDIVVPEGDTDLAPGPVLSELKSAGINVQIKAGKLSVTKDSLILKKDECISTAKAKALQTLGIYPFEVGAQLNFVYDGEVIYSPEVLSLDIDLLFKEAVIQSKNLAINAGVYSSASLAELIGTALNQAMAVSNITKK